MTSNYFFDKVKIKNGKIKYFGRGGSQNKPIDIQTTISPINQSTNASTAMPDSSINGGLYANGPQFNGPWGNIPGPATTDYQINQNLKSANGNPNSLVQYPGTGRLGNNYQAMEGINWYTDTAKTNPGPFHIQCPNNQKGGYTKN